MSAKLHCLPPSSRTPARPRKPGVKFDIHATFAIAFNNWRQQQNLPLKQVAADLGLPLGTVSLWAVGERLPRKSHLAKLAEYTGLPPCRLFCVMPDKCIPLDCLRAMRELNLIRRATPPCQGVPLHFNAAL